MRTISSRLALVAALLLPFGAASAQQPTPVAAPVVAAKPIPVPDAPQLAAPSYILVDYNSGKVLAEKNADQRVEPASLTKLMTAYIVFSELKSGHLKLTDMVTISEKAWRSEGSRTFVQVGNKVPVDILLKGLIIQSGNDASIALAEHIAGTEEVFAQLMNQYAHDLGMTGSHFMNATGLPHADHYTTARDLARLSIAEIRNFPEYHALYAMKEFTWNNIKQYNRNRLLWSDPTVDGLKTGHTQTAGYCLAATAERDNMRLVSIIMGTDSEKARAEQTGALLNYGFRFYETRKLYEARAPLATPKVWKGAVDSLPLGLTQDLWVTFPRQQYDQLKANLTINTVITAPVAAGAEMGNLVVTLGDDTVAKAPLVSLGAVEQGGLWTRMIDDLMLRWKD